MHPSNPNTLHCLFASLDLTHHASVFLITHKHTRLSTFRLWNPHSLVNLMLASGDAARACVRDTREAKLLSGRPRGGGVRRVVPLLVGSGATGAIRDS